MYNVWSAELLNWWDEPKIEINYSFTTTIARSRNNPATIWQSNVQRFGRGRPQTRHVVNISQEMIEIMYPENEISEKKPFISSHLDDMEI